MSPPEIKMLRILRKLASNAPVVIPAIRARSQGSLAGVVTKEAPPIECKADFKDRYVLKEVAQDLGYQTDGKTYRFDESKVEYVFTKDCPAT